MLKSRWLTVVGALCMVAVFFMSEYAQSMGSFITIGTIQSFIVIGLGEILHHLKNGGKSNGNKSDKKNEKDE